jgi:hypothetical protein
LAYGKKTIIGVFDEALGPYWEGKNLPVGFLRN